MSFPGHAKSIQISREPAIVSISKSSDVYKELRAFERQTSAEASELRNHIDHASPKSLVASSPADDDITDDKGNKPTRSLWVGNTYHGMRNSQLYKKFGAFGPIESAIKKPMTRYSFVNFVNVKDAIAAWKSLDGTSPFEDDKPLHIRFTAPELEAKQTKEESSVRKSSTSKKSRAARAERSRANGNEGKRLSKDHAADEIIWPNGPPPSAPKSHRKDISPPPLRRGGDSYRPSDRPVHDTYRPSVEERDVDRETRRKGPDVYRPKSSRRSRSRSRSRSTSRSSSDRDSYSSSLYETPRQRCSSSPVPWERNTKSVDNRMLDVTLKIQEAKERAQIIAANLLASRENAKPRDTTQLVTPAIMSGEHKVQVDIQKASPARPQSSGSYSPMSHVSYQDRTPREPSVGIGPSSQHALDSCPAAPVASPTRNAIPQSATKSVSSSVPYSKRLRIEREETCSIISELTTSTKSSIRKKKCADCKKPGNDLSPLVACSTCPRRFHSGCGEPRPSSWYVDYFSSTNESCAETISAIKTMFKCGRCTREKQPDAKLAAVSAEIGKSHLASPPLSLSNTESNDAASLSREFALIIDTSSTNDSSFFQTNTPQTPATSAGNVHSLKNGISSKSYIGTMDGAAEERDDIQRGPGDKATDQNRPEVELKAIINMQKYKGVTCHYWWTQGQCWLAEEQCLYAHRDTGIQRPDHRRPSKAWTCWKWLNEHNCPHSEQNCVYAHKDTGFHVASDGRVSLKHITCIWWIKSDACKWSGETCRFAHEDTGVYALEPGDKRFRGSAISSIRPVPSWKVPKTEQTKRPSKGMNGVPDQDPSIQTVIAEGADSIFKMNLDEEVPVYARPKRRVSLLSGGTRDGVPGFGAFAGQQLSLGLPISGSPQARKAEHSSLLQTNLETRPETEDTNKENTQSVEERDTPRLDPRRRRQTAPTGSSNLAKQLVDLSPASLRQLSNDNHVNDNVTRGSPEVARGNQNGANTQTPITSKTKKCNICSKIVFNDVLCRGCKELKSPVEAVLPVAVSQIPASTAPPVRSRTVDEAADFVMDDFDAERAEKPRAIPKPTVKLGIKRSASGDNMFIPNKRPKSSMAFSHAGSFRSSTLVPLRNARIVERPPVKTLEQLAREARIQNGKLPDGPEPFPSAAVDCANENDADKTVTSLIDSSTGADDDADEDMMILSAPEPDSAKLKAPTHAGDIDDMPVTKPDEASVSSGSDSLDIPYSAEVELSHYDKDKEEPEQQKRPPWSPSNNPQRPRKSARPVVRACQECNEKHRKCTHGAQERAPASTLKAHNASEPPIDRTGNKMATEPIRSQPRVINDEPIQFVCSTCRRHHKKCLHNQSGLFDPFKCSIYIKHRTSRPSCYSSAEWDKILWAAENHDSSDQSSHKDVSAGSDVDEPVSPYGHDDLSQNGYSDEDDDEAINEIRGVLGRPVKPRKPSPELPIFEDIVPAPENAAPKRKTKTRRERHDLWTADDHKKHTEELRARGVMFESESDSDDYESSDDETQEAWLSTDPLFVPERMSCDLYKVCPKLHPSHPTQQYGNWPLGRKTKVSRKEEWRNLRSTQLRTRLENFQNPHREMNRMKPDTMVTALVERVMPGVKDALVPEIQIRQERISFRDFIGLPRQPLACLMDDRVTLAYRDAIKDGDYIYSATSTRGFGRQVTEEDRLPVYDK